MENYSWLEKSYSAAEIWKMRIAAMYIASDRAREQNPYPYRFFLAATFCFCLCPLVFFTSSRNYLPIVGSVVIVSYAANFYLFNHTRRHYKAAYKQVLSESYAGKMAGVVAFDKDRFPQILPKLAPLNDKPINEFQRNK